MRSSLHNHAPAGAVFFYWNKVHVFNYAHIHQLLLLTTCIHTAVEGWHVFAPALLLRWMFFFYSPHLLLAMIFRLQYVFFFCKMPAIPYNAKWYVDNILMYHIDINDTSHGCLLTRYILHLLLWYKTSDVFN